MLLSPKGIPLLMSLRPTARLRAVFRVRDESNTGLWGVQASGGRRRVLRSERIDRLAVLAHFEMQMRPGAPAGAADARDHLPARDGLAGVHDVRR
jgi:hypothetical protein